MDTLSEKIKSSAVLNQAIFFTIMVFIIITIITFSMKILVSTTALHGYSKALINQINPNKILKNDETDIFSKFLENTDIIKRSFMENKIVILDNKLINDPYKIIDENFRIPGTPVAIKKNGIYYIFVGLRLFDNSKMIVGGPSLEFTAVMGAFNYISIIILIFGLIFSIIISYLLAKKSLSPTIKISKKLSKINIENLERVPEQKTIEFQVLANRLNSMLDRIEQGYEIQKQFVSDVSHELRTPLTTLNGYIKMLKRWGKNDEKLLEESIEKIETSTNYLKSMIEKLLILSKPDFNPEISIFNISDAIKEVLKLYNTQERKFIEKGTSFNVETSFEYLIIILKTLIENAVKYSEKEIEIIYDKNSIIIKDFGIGIPEDKVEHIFERFYQADTSRKDFGHGLGLSIAKKLCEKLNIKIVANSKINEGSSFKLMFGGKNSEN
ncbi:sensor histidine kinase [Tepiditoga spiralis]|uniref:sensor histidine kinase n=1 Tax=Tepiditoga spiralis TaxID=2108365 RepID=UPI0016844130|nr:HAMP domain-containing sensor histidine kinase [Tepiditoga spiralis]